MFELITFIGIIGVYVLLTGMAYQLKDEPVVANTLMIGVVVFSIWLVFNVDFAFKFVWLGN